ncbi:phosphatidylserine/phosphatidylglycerophosphate/cardiolipin synthase family protein [Synechococcus sp. MU1617]|uniref:phospholipase D-like domain-containing protein n=1 Tax=Synechococcus sp. MU1617 TaxID=2508346 RepID=UPI001CF84EE4|nr:phospholipase D-like domain-containing protein [Synechococcus sp. MU1617]MCB4389685.1 phospholipase [Synechococcus sp. MU1617]
MLKSKLGWMAAALLCSGCSQAGSVVGTAPADLAMPKQIDVVFNHNARSRYRSPLTGDWRNGDDMEAWLIEAIDAANDEVLVAVQELSLPRIAEALIAAENRGVRIAVILENSYSQAWSEQRPSRLNQRGRQRWDQLNRLADSNGDGSTSPEEAFHADAVALLQAAQIPLIDDTEDGSSGSGLMHHKFLVIDQTTVITGSANLTSSGLHGDAGRPSSRGNVNHLLRFHSPELALVFRKEFTQMWGDGPGGEQDSRFGLQKAKEGVQTVQIGGTRVDALFSPHPKRDANHGLNLLADQLEAARERIDMALFVFSAQQLTNVLRDQIERGVEFRLVADPGFASRPFSEVLDLLGVTLPDHSCKVEAGNHPLQQGLKGIGTPRLARGDKLHHKFAVIDQRKVITGSFNWSPSAAHTNDETLLVIHSAKLAAHFTREMDRLWDSAELGITPRIQRKLERQKIRCGDGVERR